MINKLTIDGLRGKSFALELGAVTLIAGRNTAGKTTVADAIRFGLMGYLPSMPPPPRSWAELLKDGEASVTVENGDGPRTSRIYKNGKSIKIEAPHPVANLNLLSLDAAAFMEGTEAQRASMLAAASAGKLEWQTMVPANVAERYPLSGYVSWQKWVDEAIEKEGILLSESKVERDMYIRTVRGMEQLRGAIAPDEAQIETERMRVENEIIRVKTDLAGLDRALVEAKKPRKQSPDQKRLAQLEAELRALPPCPNADPLTLVEREAANAGVLVTLRLAGPPLSYAERMPLRSKATAMEKAVSATERTMEILSAKLGAVGKRYDELREAKKCPTCGCAGKTLAASVSQLEEAEKEAIEAELFSIRAKLGPLKEDCLAAGAATEKAEKLANDWATAEAQSGELVAERRLVDLRRLADEIFMRVTIEDANTKVNDTQALSVRRYELTCDLGDLEEERTAIGSRKREADHIRSQLRTLGEAEKALKAAEHRVVGHNDLVKRLKDLRDGLTTATLQPVLDAMRAFTEGIFESPLQFNGADLGRFVGSKWIVFRQFSGMERAVATAALTCALRADSTQANIVICDELGTLDDVYLGQFLENVVKAVETGLLTQFVGLTPPRAAECAYPSGVKIIAIGG